MTPTAPRFRDSGPIRTGVGIIAVVIAFFLGFAIAYSIFGYNPPAGPSALWGFIWIVVGSLLVLVGIGQTIVRRRQKL